MYLSSNTPEQKAATQFRPDLWAFCWAIFASGRALGFGVASKASAISHASSTLSERSEAQKVPCQLECSDPIWSVCISLRIGSNWNHSDSGISKIIHDHTILTAVYSCQPLFFTNYLAVSQMESGNSGVSQAKEIAQPEPQKASAPPFLGVTVIPGKAAVWTTCWQAHDLYHVTINERTNRSSILISIFDSNTHTWLYAPYCNLSTCYKFTKYSVYRFYWFPASCA